MIYPLIEIVGVDAAGKTKLAEKLAERIDGKYVHLPSDEDEIERKAIRASGNLQALFHFYFGINARFTQENKRALQKHPVIVEPYFTSTMANLILSGAGMTTAPYEIMQPDFQIYLNPSNWDGVQGVLVNLRIVNVGPLLVISFVYVALTREPSGKLPSKIGFE